MDIQGKLINKWEIIGFDTVSKDININAYKKGVYHLLFISNDNKFKTIKFVKAE